MGFLENLCAVLGPAAVLSVCSCSDHVGCVERTSPIVQYVTPSNFCEIVLYDSKSADPAHAARYKILASNPDRGAAVCSSKKFDGVDCTVEQGPTPTFCVRGGGCAQIGFLDADANALKSFLGTDTYDMSVNCDGSVRVVHYQNIDTDAAPDPTGDPALQIGCYSPLPN